MATASDAAKAADTSGEAGPPSAFRQTIALRVIGISGGLLAVMTIAVAAYAGFLFHASDKEGATGLIEKYLFAVLPMIGTWVGTVLAFYFSTEGFQTASSETRLTMAETRDTRLRRVPVQQAMIPITAVQGVCVDKPDWPNSDFKASVLSLLSTTKVGRVPVFNKVKTEVYGILRDADIKDFAWSQGIPRDTPPEGEDEKKVDLATFLSDPVVAPVFQASLAFVGPDATLADVREAMDRARATGASCRDVFVTTTGTAAGRPLGLVTNVDLEQYGSYGQGSAQAS